MLKPPLQPIADLAHGYIHNPFPGLKMNICQQLVYDAMNAQSLENLETISSKANNFYMSEASDSDRELMTDDFWFEFSKVVRNKALNFK